MGVKIRKKNKQWYVFINHNGQRKAKCVGTSRSAATKVKLALEEKLVLGDLGVLVGGSSQMPNFDDYATRWKQEYAVNSCKPSTNDSFESVMKNHLRPRFGKCRLDQIKRASIKSFIADAIAKGMARSSIRNAISILRSILNYAIDDELLESNPATNLGKFTRAARAPKVKGIALTQEEVNKLLEAAGEVCPEYVPLFLTAVRAGLRRGELVSLQFQDLEFGKSNKDRNRYLLVQHNYVRRQHTTTKSKKSRRVDMSRGLRRVLLGLRDARLAALGLSDPLAIGDQLVFPSPEGTILDPDNLYHRYFLAAHEKSGLRKFRLHDLRHTFGSRLIQKGSPLTYVKEQMGHSSIQVTVDIYGHLVPGADIAYVDRLDEES
ncbi:MAG: site-specific integrase [Acidobacteriaceae bacterium]|nr:site-specific integrase [Acidobacteriaceae bacterium]